MKKLTARTAIFGIVAVAAPLSVATVGVSSASAADTSASYLCDYFRVTENAYVRENPSENSVIRKTKYTNDIVTWCGGPVAGPGGGSDWVAVDCSCATDGVGYIVARKLEYQGTH